MTKQPTQPRHAVVNRITTLIRRSSKQSTNSTSSLSGILGSSVEPAFRIFHLPIELRLKIYQFVFCSDKADYRFARDPNSYILDDCEPGCYKIYKVKDHRSDYCGWDARQLLFVSKRVYAEAVLDFYKSIRLRTYDRAVCSSFGIRRESEWTSFLKLTTNSRVQPNLQRVALPIYTTDFSFFTHLPNLKEVTFYDCRVDARWDVPVETLFHHSSLKLALGTHVSCWHTEQRRKREWSKLRQIALDYPQFEVLVKIHYSHPDEQPRPVFGYPNVTTFEYSLRTDVFEEILTTFDGRPGRIVKPA